MPFLIPMGIAAAGSIGSSLIGSKLAKVNPTSMENDILKQNLAAGQQGMDLFKNLSGQAQPYFTQGGGLISQGAGLLGQGAQAYNPVLNYWSGLLSGNRGGMTSMLAPEINRINEGYQQAGQTSAALMPRGGARADFLGNLPFQNQRDISTLFQSVRPQAAQGVSQAAQGLLNAGGAFGQLGGQTANIGSNLLSQAISSLYGATSAGRDILNQQQNIRAQEAANGRSIGSGIFDLFQKYGMPAITSALGGGDGSGFDTSGWRGSQAAKNS